MTPVDQAQWKMSLSQSHQMINNLYTVPRINSQNSVFLSHDVQDCPHRQQQFHMLLTDGEKQMASQRPVKQRDTCTDKSYSTLSLHITAWQKKQMGSQRPEKQKDTCTDRPYSTLSLHITGWHTQSASLYNTMCRPAPLSPQTTCRTIESIPESSRIATVCPQP